MNYITAAQLVDIELSSQERATLLERAQHRVTFDWFGTRVAACFDQQFEARVFERRYRSFLCAGEPDLWTCALQRAGDGGEPLFWAQPGPAYRYPTPLDRQGTIAFLADAVTQHAFFDVHPKVSSFHAAAIQVGNVAIAISATSTGGKSTTAIACARRGMGLYTDERCSLIDGLVYPFPRAMNIRKGGLELLACDDIPGDSGIGSRLREHEGSDWEFVQFTDLLGNRPQPQPRKLSAIFFIEGRDSVPSVAPLAPEDAILAVLRAGFCGPKPGIDRLAAAALLLQQARAYSLTLGTPDDTAMLVAATAQGVRPLVVVGT